MFGKINEFNHKLMNYLSEEKFTNKLNFEIS